MSGSIEFARSGRVGAPGGGRGGGGVRTGPTPRQTVPSLHPWPGQPGHTHVPPAWPKRLI